jgi:carboxyl-terminal processing protease
VTRYPGPVVVLTGPLIMSSAESFLLMMRVAGATLVGGRSRGSSANPQPVDLGNGITLMVPSWRALLVDGTCFEGVGIAPDVEVPVTAAEVAAGDKVIDAGVAVLDAKLAKLAK